jgi:hypothetical protein
MAVFRIKRNGRSTASHNHNLRFSDPGTSFRQAITHRFPQNPAVSFNVFLGSFQSQRILKPKFFAACLRINRAVPGCKFS